ncbi:MAG: cystathionine gamma-synthase [Candidatus Brocadia sp. AMX2]|uniref:Cystathionine gamma-lyase n=1 Tax=Candidatus Brocadia sinica JPN1 TaxID=1197129 RepID=A0ABQ0JXH6_9BACT|nr:MULTISPECIES: cystathionine gamma-synthase [Brocadia]KXK29453.1 MAG: Cystathionine beta-lyase [Candidatus Brocadia sinica]MBC6932055.1 cystathionine gamma-synthase [Candidatus Brocadia sp.]MBL1169508.1 cystathionine gamma-synthase [Candidatus Brocadia sp. AMX1]NOG40779.1 cystathionine gamma-synthase [Planctomycetota bacterium]KAA0242680.1 MAG: cystathionine gamma-synthase [Candidatus Brocadia sp. AMX2]
MEHRFETRAIHAGCEPDAGTGAIMTPIFQTSTYVQESPGKHKGYDYSRTHNPTRTALEKNIASLEEGNYGLAFSSGMSAILTIIQLFNPGDHIICCDDVYGGTFRLFDKVLKRYKLEFDFADLTNPQSLERYTRDNTKLVWLESPSNPLLKLIDIETIVRTAKKENIFIVVDNTFATPFFQKPLKLGADIVMHSTTKYLNGHSDVIGGALVTNNRELYDKLQFLQNAAGAVPGPFDCFLVLRGIKTLAVRMERHAENAMRIAQFLETHPKVRRVIYPGLKSHPQHGLARKQMAGFGGIITFFIKGGLEEARRFLERVRIFSLAESLGGVESLIEHPAIMTHASLPKEVREKLGISDELIRVSVGIENVDDLIGDLEKALS